MKKLLQLSFLGIAFAVILTSCSMEKRVYMSGYNVQWKNSSKIEQKGGIVNNQKEQKNNQNFKKINSSETIIDINEDEIITASAEKEISLPSKKIISLNRNNSKVDFNTKPTEKKR
jgi:hypothetical protein